MISIGVILRDESRRQLEVDPGQSLMSAISGAGIDELLAICGGCLSCATCHVYVSDPFVSSLAPMSQEEDDLLDASSHRTSSSRLSCQIELDADLEGLEVVIAPAD